MCATAIPIEIGNKYTHKETSHFKLQTSSFTFNLFSNYLYCINLPFFLVLKKQCGKCSPVVERQLFKPKNIYVTASKSGKLTLGNFLLGIEIILTHILICVLLLDYFKIWLKEVCCPNVDHTTVLLLDSWSDHCSGAVLETKPDGKTIILKKIPEGTSGYFLI